MRNFKRKFITLILFACLVTVLTPVTLADHPNHDAELGSNSNNDTELGSSDTQQVEPVKLVNPLGTTKTLPELIEGILRIVLTIGVPVIALAIIYAGFQFIAAQGNPQKLQEARRTLLYVLIGAGILLAAYVIAEAIVGTINAIRGNN